MKGASFKRTALVGGAVQSQVAAVGTLNEHDPCHRMGPWAWSSKRQRCFDDFRQTA